MHLLFIKFADSSSLIHITFFQCAEAQPCYTPGACINTAKGFTCEPCPLGLWGPPLSGVGVEHAKSHRQVQQHQLLFTQAKYV